MKFDYKNVLLIIGASFSQQFPVFPMVLCINCNFIFHILYNKPFCESKINEKFIKFQISSQTQHKCFHHSYNHHNTGKTINIIKCTLKFITHYESCLDYTAPSNKFEIIKKITEEN